MLAHLRANLWLLASTVILCCVVYPAVLWTFSQTFYPTKAQGSLVDRSGLPVTNASDAVGSRLIAPPVVGPQFFQPRPSAVSFNAAASGASNWGANNYQLRLRVAKSLGPIVNYGEKGPRPGEPVGPDIEAWFQSYPAKDGKGIVAQWAESYPAAAAAWAKDNKANAAYIKQWQDAHPAAVEQWVEQNPRKPEPQPEDLAAAFFASYSAEHPGTFLALTEQPSSDGKIDQVISPVTEGTDIQATFFEMWRQEHPDVDLEEVPADMVMTSGSGLDPHITLKNALFQLDRVAAHWAAKTRRDSSEVRKEIADLLHQNAQAPLGGLAGVPLVNVLEVNLALVDHMNSRSAIRVVQDASSGGPARQSRGR